jgi:hypothetical protein
MSDMDDMTMTDTDGGGISRRDMIKGSVIAGGLIWAAPVLLTGKAAAQVSDIPCCDTGLLHFEINVPSGTLNCGATQCLSNLDFIDTSFNCADDDDIETCLPSLMTLDAFSSGANGTAQVTLRPGVTLIAASAKQSARCFFTICPDFATGPTTGVPNCEQHQNDEGLDADDCEPVDATAADPNRVWVTLVPDPESEDPNPPLVQRINFAANPLTQIEFAICLAPDATGLCP